MAYLDADILALAVCELDDSLQGFHLRILPQAAVLRRDPTFRGHRRRFDHGKAWAPLDDASKVSEMPCRLMTIFSRVLA